MWDGAKKQKREKKGRPTYFAIDQIDKRREFDVVVDVVDAAGTAAADNEEENGVEKARQ